MALYSHRWRSNGIIDEHWCMSPYYTRRDDYFKHPTYPLQGVNVTLPDYQSGPLENWTQGALHFNGRSQYAVLSQSDIQRPVTMRQPEGTPPRPGERLGPEQPGDPHLELSDRGLLQDDASIYVGGTPQGQHLDGAIEFLRIARGTLADAQTTIEELHAWQFHGPFLCDFTGSKRTDGGAAGTIGDR